MSASEPMPPVSMISNGVRARQAALGDQPVAGDAGLIVNDGNLTAREPVKQRGFADVRAAHDGDGRQDGQVHGKRAATGRAETREESRSQGRFSSSSRLVPLMWAEGVGGSTVGCACSEWWSWRMPSSV